MPCTATATSEPDFHNAMNFAAVFRAPCVMICQNNHWAISVPSSKQTASRTFAVKGRAYGVPSVRVDGNDALAVWRVVADAVARARSGGGPTFIEALTYRIGAHSTSDDPTRYRSQEEVEAWMKRDPLQRLRARGPVRDQLEEQGIVMHRHGGSSFHAGLDPDSLSGGQLELRHHPRRRQEALRRVLSIHATLDRRAALRNLVLAPG